MPLIKKNQAVLSALSGVFLMFILMGHACAAAPALYSAAVSDMPEHTLSFAPQTELPIHVKPGKPQVVHLDADVGRVTVDDMPAHVSAVIYDSRSIILFPHSASAGAHITVFGKDGKPFMARYVVIDDPDKKYIRINQVCKNGHDAACEKTSIYYCPNLCYETRLISTASTVK